jgi:hypothetical protein
MAKERAPWDEEEVAPWETPAPSQSGFSSAIREMANEIPNQQKGLTKEKMIEATLSSLPTIGMLGGGLVGTGLGPAGSVGGAGLGAAGGKALEDIGRTYLLGEQPKPMMDRLKGIGEEAIGGMMGEMGGQVVGKAISKGISQLPKVAHALTGVPEQEIKTYAKNADKVKEMARSSEGSTIEAADQIRQQYNKDIGSKIGEINNEISNVLSKSNKTVQSQPVIDSLEKYKSSLDPSLWKNEVKQIDDIIASVKGMSPDGVLPVAKVHELKQFLQDKASSAYRNGDMFQIGKEAANASKSAAATARQLVDQAEPSVTKLNKQLSEFHRVEDSMNSNILKSGAPEASLMAAGSGGNARNAAALEELGMMTDSPMLEQAQNLAAMRTFNNAPFMPLDVTGKSATRLGAGAGIGFALGGAPGAAVGAAATSPFALKTVIDTGRAIAPAVNAITPSAPTREMLYKGLIQKYYSSPEDKVVEEKKAPDQTSIMDKVKGTPYEQVLQNSLKSGGDKSFAAANYVLQNRDEKYRRLFEET